DFLVCQQLSQVAGEVVNSALGGGVGEQDRVGLIRIDRGRIDDHAARLHVFNGRFAQVKHGVDVDAESALPLLVADVINGFETCLVRGIVYEDVNAAERRERFVDDGAAGAWGLPVAAGTESLSAPFVDPCL